MFRDSDLFRSLRELGTIHSIQNLLSWDQETMMPADAAPFRSDAIAWAAKISHEKFTSEAFQRALGQYLDPASGTFLHSGMVAHDQRFLSLVFRDWQRAKALPPTFVEEWAKLCSQAQFAWQQARKENRFSHFSPCLNRLIGMAKEKAQRFGFEGREYDGLLDEFEPELTRVDLDPIFGALVPAIRSLMSRFPCPPPRTLPIPFDTDRQMAMSRQLLSQIGFDLTRARLDVSSHPFSIDMHPSDVRITTRFKTTDILEGLSGTLHEMGHALYEQGLDPEWFGTPFGSYLSLGLHESQSRLWENAVGKRLSFWKGIFPLVKTYFPVQFAAETPESIFREVNAIRPGLIRVESDEVTYNLHIALRYDVECKLFSGQIQPDDLPEVWNAAFEQYFGFKPATDSQGVLQDVHWSQGAFGYFPTYTLGNLYAAQFWDQIEKDIPTIDAQFEVGEFGALRTWLRDNVHQHGRRFTAAELVQRITGSSLSIDPFVAGLERKLTLTKA